MSIPMGLEIVSLDKYQEASHEAKRRQTAAGEKRRTVSIIVEVDQLIIPLCNDPQRIF